MFHYHGNPEDNTIITVYTHVDVKRQLQPPKWHSINVWGVVNVFMITFKMKLILNDVF